MRSLLLRLSALLISVLPAVSAAPVPDPVSVSFKGEPVIRDDWRDTLLASGQALKKFGHVEAGSTGDSVRFVTIEQPPHIYSLQAQVLNTAPVKTGDTLFIRFAARSIKAEAATGVTKLRVNFSRSAPPWEASHSSEVGLSSEWQRFDIPFACKNDFAPGQGRLAFTYGFPAQTLELADIQVLRYDPQKVAVSDLPKTRRFADPVSAETLQTELARIARLRAELDAVKDPAPAKGRVLSVSPSDSIQDALDRAQPGDTILVAAGTYDTGRGLSVRNSGHPDAWIKLHAAPGARPKLISSGWSGIELRGGIGYVEIAGFELEWIADPANTDPVHGAGIAPMYASHHIRILNNVVHGFGTGGIVSLDCDYLHIEGNVIHNTSKTSPYGGSAISLCRAFDFDKFEGYRNVLRGNIAYDNELTVVTQVSSGGTGRTLTDGNGIIIDVFNKSRANPLKPHGEDRDGPLAPYTGRTLIENNLMHDNGGRGIHVFRSSHVDVVNNTTHMNQKSRDIQAGELTAVESSHVVFLNNLCYGRLDKRGNTQDGSSRVIWHRNLFFNVADVLVHDGIIEADPLFVAPAHDAKSDGFRLRPGSPALRAGALLGAATTDLEGRPRPAKGPIDIGAYQSAR
ncbi:MAG: right-handed parallel beta-helix repeat-containing protein [Burkholderiales bacterium]|nr:right-handed parallel beta-helix repeat-containing protein [Opitutaceae bacterium]